MIEKTQAKEVKKYIVAALPEARIIILGNKTNSFYHENTPNFH